MFNRYGRSSEVYNIEIDDILCLPDTQEEIKKAIKQQDEIAILIRTSQDSLVFGRELIEQAKKDGKTHIPVRILFKMRYPVWKLNITIIKKLRLKKTIKSSNIYHIIPQDIRDLNIERCHRTAANAYQNNDLGKISQDAYERYLDLSEEIIKHGYNDSHPMDVRLCRNMGVQDTINQGHHRMGILIESKIHRACIYFSAVGFLNTPFYKWQKKLAQNKLAK